MNSFSRKSPDLIWLVCIDAELDCVQSNDCDLIFMLREKHFSISGPDLTYVCSTNVQKYKSPKPLYNQTFSDTTSHTIMLVTFLNMNAYQIETPAYYILRIFKHKSCCLNILLKRVINEDKIPDIWQYPF